MAKGMALEDKRTGTQPLMVCCCLKLTIACIQRFYVCIAAASCFSIINI
jgi:hypothetical protein